MSKKRVSKPEWLHEYRRRTRIIEVIDMAFDKDVSDKDVRAALVETAEELGDLFGFSTLPGKKERR